MPKCQKPKDYCPIRFTLWTPDNASMLDFEWTPLPPRKHVPLKVRAHRIGQRIAAEEFSYLKARLAALGTVIREEQNLLHFQKELDGLEQRVLAALGVK